MAKRISTTVNRSLILGCLMVVALVLMANGPPGEKPTDPDGEVVWAPWDANPVVHYTIPRDPDGFVEHSEADGELIDWVVSSSAGPRNHTVVCSIFANRPWRSGSNARGDAAQECSGSTYAEGRLKFALQRHKAGPWWVNLNTWDSGWFPAYNIYRVGSGSFKTGTHTYRAV